MSSNVFSSFFSLNRIKDQSKVFLSNSNKLDNFWIYGAGNNGRKILELLKERDKRVRGFIDDTPQKSGQEIDGVKILDFESFKTNVKSSDNIVVSIFSAKNRFLSICERLNSLNLNKVLSAHETFCMFGQKFYFIEQLSEIEKRIEKYNNIFDCLSDDDSRDALTGYLNLKIYFKFYKEKHKFFEPINSALKDTENVTFLDIGAFDGDTVILFHEQFGNKIKRTVALEPDFANYNNLLKNLFENKIDSLCLNLAVSDKTNILRFNAAGNMSSALDDEGDTLIQAISIDDITSFFPKNSKLIVKMDVEGFEMDCINGMMNTIKNLRPILAISVYHKPNDLIDIFERVLKIDNSYKVWLRYHGYDGADLTAYFI